MIFIFLSTVRPCFWNALPLEFKPSDHPGHSVLDWILEALDSLRKQQLELLLMSLWTIWSERNNIIWNGGDFNPLHMATWTIKQLEEYQKLHPLKSNKKKGTITHWLAPPRW